jgi:hypothetical protein
MKNLFVLSLLFIAGKLTAQYSFTVTEFNEIDLETKETKSSFPVKQIFNFSLKDKYLIHNVLNESGVVEDSQLYKIIEQKDKDGVLFLTCKSGVSGNSYQYLLGNDGSGGKLLYQVSGNTLYQLQGSMTTFKTFKQ